MKTKLITALRAAAHALEEGSFAYNWKTQESCNCGALYCALNGTSAHDFDRQLRESGLFRGSTRTWTEAAGRHCPITGVPTHKLFFGLAQVGVTARDIRHLEYLSDPVVKARVERHRREGKVPRRDGGVWITSDYADRHEVADYMRAWAEILEEEGRADLPEHTVSSAYLAPVREEESAGV